MKVSSLFIMWAMLNLVGAKSFAAEVGTEESPFKCQTKILVEQVPGLNWSNLGKVIDKHLGFMIDQMKAGNILSAGPIVNENGEPQGGTAIYALSDAKKAQAIAETDPLIVEGVSTILVKPWVECVLK